MLIDSYSFGQMWIGGHSHQADLLLLPERQVLPNWVRKVGHSLLPEDLAAVVAAKPDRFIMGCGTHAMLTIPPATLAYLQERGIKVYSANTAKAVLRWNEWHSQPGLRLAAGFHLTC